MRPLSIKTPLMFAMFLPASAFAGDAPDLAVAVETVLGESVEATRVALPPATGGDEDSRAAVEAEVLRLLLERENEEVVTPAYIARVLDAAAISDAAAYGPLAADHVLLVSIVDAAGERAVELKLLHTESGGVVGQTRAPWGSGAASSVSATTARGAVGRLVDQLFVSLGKLPGEHRYQRVAVAGLEARGEGAQGSRVDRFLRAEVSRSLAGRGFLLVEREQLDAALAQQTLGAMLDESTAPAIGKLVDAQAIVTGSVADAGEVFEVTLRVIGVESGAVLGAASTTMPRAGVVTLASDSIETRSAGEAVFRSVVAPGWGQFYNRRPVKGAAFASVGYGAAATTVALGAMSILSVSAYDGYVPGASTPAAAASLEAKGLRETANVWLTATAVSGVITGSVWALGVADAMLDGIGAEAVNETHGGTEPEKMHTILRTYITDNGMKSSRQREIIADVFFHAGGHLRVDELLARVREVDEKIGQATVYRTMKLLTECGLAQPRQFGDGHTRYEPVAPDEHEHHDHLICEECGKIVEFVDERIEKLQEKVAAEHGYQVTTHKMELYGICADCR